MKDLNEVVDPLTIASIVAITGGAVAITATLASKLHKVLSDRSVDFKVEKTYKLIKKKYPAIFAMIRDQRFGKGKLAQMVRDVEDEIPGLKKKSFMNNITSIIDQLMKHHSWSTSSDTSGKLDPDRFHHESVNEYVGPKYKTANEIKKHWKKEYPNAEFTFKKVRAKGNDWLLVLSPKGVELERYQHVPKTGWVEMNEGKETEEDIKSLQAILDVASELSPKNPYFKGRGSKDAYIKMIKSKLSKLGIIAAGVAGDHRITETSEAEGDRKSFQAILDTAMKLGAKNPYFKGRGSKQEYIKMLQHKLSKLEVHEMIKVPISVGDTILGGKFKNKKIVVKKIGKNEKGDLTINGRPLLKYRVLKKKGTAFEEGKKKKQPATRMDAYKRVRKKTMPKSRPMKSKKTYDRKKLRKGEDD